ncbi:hypothetical protein T11_2398 [Trichinella zimbabwensis]|uniref:Uncharacterized protein n=1 Tax=Trichinella zimbabwensis TaxID=268475 RepID=A0A0V1H7E0_9BILA|nr:hypothetical protein T11_2398 [Trichinella zimbabwensis]
MVKQNYSTIVWKCKFDTTVIARENSTALGFDQDWQYLIIEPTTVGHKYAVAVVVGCVEMLLLALTVIFDCTLLEIAQSLVGFVEA